jgi:hypothetical protein
MTDWPAFTHTYQGQEAELTPLRARLIGELEATVRAMAPKASTDEAVAAMVDLYRTVALRQTRAQWWMDMGWKKPIGVCHEVNRLFAPAEQAQARALATQLATQLAA